MLRNWMLGFPQVLGASRFVGGYVVAWTPLCTYEVAYRRVAWCWEGTLYVIILRFG